MINKILGYVIAVYFPSALYNALAIFMPLDVSDNHRCLYSAVYNLILRYTLSLCTVIKFK